jgi:uncharacterized protein YoxC
VSLLNIFLIVAALSLAGIAVALVPMLLQLKRTAEKAELLMDTLNRDISPLLHSLSETVAELRTLTIAMEQKMDKVDGVLDTVQDTGDILRTTAIMLKKSVIPVISHVGGLGAGISTFIHYLTRSGKNN